MNKPQLKEEPGIADQQKASFNSTYRIGANNLVVLESSGSLTQQVFISYSSENENDRLVADKIYNILKAKRIPCWVAHRNLEGGQKWPTEISKAISNSRAMIVVLSEHTQKSRYVEMEVTQAAEEKLTIIPFCSEKVSLPACGLKLLLGNCHWITDLDQLVRTLYRSLEIKPTKNFKRVKRQPLNKKKTESEN